MSRTPSLAEQMRDRLDAFVDAHVGSRYRLVQRCPGIAHSTVTGWFKPRPTTPRADNLVELATRLNLNPSWLLLGEGPELRGGPEPNLLTRYREAVVAEAAAAEGMAPEQAARYVPLSEDLFRAAVEQVRAFLRTPAARTPVASTGGGEPEPKVIQTIRWHRPPDGTEVTDTVRPSEDGTGFWTSEGDAETP